MSDIWVVNYNGILLKGKSITLPSIDHEVVVKEAPTRV